MDGMLARIRHRTSSGRPPVLPPIDTTDSADDSLPLLLQEEKDAPKRNLQASLVMLLPRTPLVWRCNSTSLKPPQNASRCFKVLIIILVLVVLPLLYTAIPAVLWRMTARWFRTVHPDTYTHECKHHCLHNDSWGRMVAPYVDKLQVKHLVKSMLAKEEDSPGRHFYNKTTTTDALVKVAPVLAIYDQSNLSLFTSHTLQSLPQPYFIKPTHTSGGLARIANDTYECFKGCRFRNRNPITPLGKAFGTAKNNMKHSLSRLFSNKEPQYQYIPHRIILEERVPMDDLREFLWFTVNGHPVFAICICHTNTGTRNTTSFSAAFGELPELYDVPSDPCETFEKPLAFPQMLEAVRVLGKQLPPGIVRIDLFVNDVDVYFGEFTFTSSSCRIHFQPAVADRLLQALLHGDIQPSQVTPEFVERLINVTPWFRVNLYSRQLSYEAITAYPSEKALCNETNDPASCLIKSQDIKFSSLRCILVQENDVTALGQDKLSWMSVVIKGMDIPALVAISAVLILMLYFGMGDKPGGRIRNNAYFLLAATMYIYLKPHCNSLTSRPSLFLQVIQRSFHAFVMVHPVEDRALLLVHYVTYWFPIAAWRAKTPQRMLFWWLLYQAVALGVNEFCHHREEYGEIQCARMSFIYIMEQHAMDETIRKYILPPFFVYGYLVPKQFMCLVGFRDCSLSMSDFRTVYNKYY